MNNRMITIFLAVTLLSFSLVATACEHGPTEQPKPDVELTLINDLIAVNEAGGEFEVGYALSGLDDEALVEATGVEPWIEGVSLSPEALVFSVAANGGTEAREGRVELRYDGECCAALTVRQSAAPQHLDIFTTQTTADTPYRIPAICVTPDGTIICAADYRHSYKDIGVVENGRIDLHARRSGDHGATWGGVETIINGQGASSPDFMNVGYGDPCIVADRESGRVLLLSCAGNVSFQQGTRQRHQCIARFYSDDGGATWSAPEDIAESIYSQFDGSPFGPVKSMFVASGRILQSATVKVGSHYRLYCSVLVRDVNDNYTNYKNFVLYSDDFGGAWHILGGAAKAAVTKADEAKVEELPDGSLLISSRTNGGRYYNIFRFKDVASGSGSWQTQVFSGAHNGGVEAKENSTNGEVMLLPAVRQSDGKHVHLLLQSLPMGPGRSSVGVYYKAFVSADDYSTPERIAKDWEGVKQLTTLDAAYSTMTLQRDTRIGLLWEEATHCAGGDGYTIRYASYSVEQITDNRYRLLL